MSSIVSGALNSLQYNLNEPRLEAELFNTLRNYIYELTGIYFQDAKKYLLESRLNKRIKFLGLDSYEEYWEYIRKAGYHSEKRYLFEAVTINETFFFRNQPQLDALASTVIPSIIDVKRRQGRNKVRIWSAASSSGEEAYSIAIFINDLIKPKYPDIEFEIIGTDISQSVIDTANGAVYREYSIRNTPSYYLKKYFKYTGGSYILDPTIKRMVSFKILNLYDNSAMRMMFNYDIIFCANVLIYFNKESKIKVVNNLYNSLNKEGYLFIGYSETLHSISKAFRLVSFPKTIGYKKD